MKTFLLLVCCAFLPVAVTAATNTERIRNEKVIASELTLAPGEAEPAHHGFPSVVVFFADGAVQDGPAGARPASHPVRRGEVIYRNARDPGLRAAGTAELHFIRIEFCGPESGVTWGRVGFAPSYKLLLENSHVRVADIHIAAGSSEPQHTHRERVVVCLSGAQLRHVLPDGHEENSSIKTGECLWRLGQTHIGKNIGTTDLWVIAFEPK